MVAVAVVLVVVEGVGRAGTVGAAVGVVGEAVLVVLVEVVLGAMVVVEVVVDAPPGVVVVLEAVVVGVVATSAGASPREAGRGLGPPFMTSEKR